MTSTEARLAAVDLSDLIGDFGTCAVFELYCDIASTVKTGMYTTCTVTNDAGVLTVDFGGITYSADAHLTLREQALYIVGLINSHYADTK